jgi:hypothetical protein
MRRLPPMCVAGDIQGGTRSGADREHGLQRPDEAIAATCSAVRGSAKSKAKAKAIDHQLVRAEDCLAQDSCEAFVSGLEPVLESFLR